MKLLSIRQAKLFNLWHNQVENIILRDNLSMKISELGEFGLIDRISRGIAIPEGVVGIGDDCAIIPQKEGKDLIVSTDMLMESIHFLKQDIRPYSLGWKSAAVNLSDIAAMGGRPLASFLSIALPKDIDCEWIEEFIHGYKDISGQYNCPLLGGDTVSSPDRICINVAILGEVESGKALRRSGARNGDKICVTGNLGNSGGGLKVIMEGVERDSAALALIKEHYQPVPRIKEGLALLESGVVHCMMDISDGLVSDLRHLLEASGKGAELDARALPLSSELRRCCELHGWDPVEIAVGGGEDYELLFTAEASAEIPVPHSVIGRITDEAGEIRWVGTSKTFEEFRHF